MLLNVLEVLGEDLETHGLLFSRGVVPEKSYFSKGLEGVLRVSLPETAPFGHDKACAHLVKSLKAG